MSITIDKSWQEWLCQSMKVHWQLQEVDAPEKVGKVPDFHSMSTRKVKETSGTALLKVMSSKVVIE